jgi:hypothetical protein
MGTAVIIVRHSCMLLARMTVTQMNGEPEYNEKLQKP